MRDLPKIAKIGFNTFAKSIGVKNLFIEKKVRELLFEGYSDPLLDIAKFIPPDFPVKIPPYDRFGWFYTVSFFL